MDQKEEVQTLSMQESSVLKQIMPKTKVKYKNRNQMYPFVEPTRILI